jgi:hypothetical protein
VTFTKGQKIDGIQQICLLHTIISNKAIDLRRKYQFSFPDIFVIEYGYGV